MNSEKIKLAKKRHYDINSETIRIIRKQYYDENKELILEKVREKRQNMSMYDCLKTFRKEIVWGAICPCVSCHGANCQS